MSDEAAGGTRRAAFEAETLPHLARVYSAARRFDFGAADDLVQETFLRAYRTFDNFRPGTNSLAWLLTILYSVFVNRYRREKRQPESWTEEDLESNVARRKANDDWEAPLLEAAESSQWGTGKTVTGALEKLPVDYRSAVLLVDVEGLTYEEAAGALECPVGTVRSRLFRARRKLAAELTAYASGLGFGAQKERS
ncbi:MAG: sigma-70 family RNA polymerase sigma factor [Thermoanaerobaculia bacterium]